MARVYLDSGSIGFRITAADEAARPIPGTATGTITFDEDTNSSLLIDLMKTTTPYSISGAQLLKNGSPVTIQPDGDRKGLLAAAANAVTSNNTYIAIASPSNAQIAAQVKSLTQQNNALIKRLIQLR